MRINQHRKTRVTMEVRAVNCIELLIFLWNWAFTGRHLYNISNKKGSYYSEGLTRMLLNEMDVPGLEVGGAEPFHLQQRQRDVVA